MVEKEKKKTMECFGQQRPRSINDNELDFTKEHIHSLA